MTTMSLFETVRRIVADEVGRMRMSELAIVQESHPHASDSDIDNYACTVRLRDSGIVLRHVPVATQRIGDVSVPAEGELVLVQFIGGDINAPIIVGRLYNDEDRPPVSEPGRSVIHLPLGAAEDDAVHLEMLSGERREVLLTLGKGLTLTLKDDDPVVEVKVDGGKAAITIARDGAVTLESQGSVKVKGSDIKMEGDAITLEASGDLKLKGGTVNIN